MDCNRKKIELLRLANRHCPKRDKKKNKNEEQRTAMEEKRQSKVRESVMKCIRNLKERER